jgi:hypothetical protein
LYLQIDADPDPDPAYHYDADGDVDPDPAYPFDPDPEADPGPTFHFDAYPCGSGSTTLASPEVLFSPKKVIIFRARKGLITDIWARSLEQSFSFVSVYVKREFPYTVLSEVSWKDLFSPI